MDEQRDGLRISNAMLMYYMHIPNPDSLSDIDFAMRLKELEYIRIKEAGEG